jgi:hypothetical protein
MKKLWHAILGTAIICLIIYGFYWIVKTVTYTIFYEDMVKATITEMVKQVALR